MKKLFILLLFIVIAFGGCYFVYSKINWSGLFGVKKITENVDEQLGDVFWKSYSAEMVEVKDRKVVLPILQMVDQLSSANGIKSSTIKIHVVENNEINAFAMPGRHLVVHTGLIDFLMKIVENRQATEDEIQSAIETAENEMIRNGIVAIGDICNTTSTIAQKSKANLHYQNFIEAYQARWSGIRLK